MKILVVAGHGAGDSGAVGNGFKECDLTRELSAYVVDALNSIADVTLYPVDRNLYKDLKNGQNNARNLLSGFDFIFEIHLNSAVNTSAEGVEVLCKRDSVFSRTLLDNVTIAGLKKRTVVLRKNLLNMNVCDTLDKPYVLLECGFISNYHDVFLFKNNQKKIAQAIANSFISCYNLKKQVSENKKLYRVQVGAFAVKENAKKLQTQLKNKGFNCFITGKDSDGFYRVQCGAFENVKNANSYKKEIQKAGFDAFVKGY